MTVQALGDAAGARDQLGAAYEPMLRYAELLVSEGVTRGLIGPREAPRLWERHLLNSAAMTALLPQEGRVVDLGSGAGLPGVVLALCLPSLQITLVDATRRRTDFLAEVVHDLGLSDRVCVVWGRAEDLPSLHADIVVARAVAPLGRLANWSMPHLKAGGSLLAMKGESAAEELAREGAGLRRLGVADAELLTVGSADDALRVIRLVKGVGAARRPQRARPGDARVAGRRRLPRSAAEKE